MKTTVVAVGRVRSTPCKELCADYSRRLARFAPLEVVEVKEGRGLAGPQARSVEGTRLGKLLPTGAHCVSLDERGRAMTSKELASWLEGHSRQGVRDLRFVVGGAWGLDPDVLTRCSESLRLSSMTLPHELARVVFLEQLYRAWSILRGLPYHNE